MEKTVNIVVAGKVILMWKTQRSANAILQNAASCAKTGMMQAILLIGLLINIKNILKQLNNTSKKKFWPFSIIAERPFLFTKQKDYLAASLFFLTSFLIALNDSGLISCSILQASSEAIADFTPSCSKNSVRTVCRS